MPTQKLWIELRIHCDERSQNRLLVEAVTPFLDEVIQQSRVVRGYFLRNKKQGKAYLSLYLDSNLTHTDELLQQLYDVFEQRELQGVINQVEIKPSIGAAEVQENFQGPAAPTLLENFFCDTNAFVLHLVSKINGDRTVLLQTAFDLMVAQVVTINRNIFQGSQRRPYPNSFLSYRSHADGFFIMSKKPQSARELFENRYITTSASMQKRLRELLQQLDDNGPSVSHPAQNWVSYVDTYIKHALVEISSGRLTIIEDQSGYLGDQNDISISSFHQVIQHDTRYQEFMRTDAEFLAMRTMHTYLYWTLHRLGLQLVERYFLCYSVSRSFEEVFGVNPTEALTAITNNLSSHVHLSPLD